MLCSSNRCDNTLQKKEKVHIPEPNIKSQHATDTPMIAVCCAIIVQHISRKEWVLQLLRPAHLCIAQLQIWKEARRQGADSTHAIQLHSRDKVRQ